MRVLVAGLGYVGLTNAVLFATRGHEVRGLEASPVRAVEASAGRCFLRDPELEAATVEIPTWLVAEEAEALHWADLVIVALPTNWDEEVRSFDTKMLEALVHRAVAAGCDVVIRSTVGVGTTTRLRSETRGEVAFVPEFLREGSAWADTLRPSRVVSGGAPDWFVNVLEGGSGCEVLRTTPSEAEMIKLASNAYLAMRVAYFNELDTFCHAAAADTAQVIRGVELDPRIGSGYNNPSVGYGGYCLPKDTLQLASQFGSLLLPAATRSNDARIRWVAGEAVRRAGENGVVGVWRLDAKAGSDNRRESASTRLVEVLRRRGARVVVWDPSIPEAEVGGIRVTHDTEVMKGCGVIVANRADDVLDGLAGRVWVVGVHRWG